MTDFILNLQKLYAFYRPGFFTQYFGAVTKTLFLTEMRPPDYEDVQIRYNDDAEIIFSDHTKENGSLN